MNNLYQNEAQILEAFQKKIDDNNVSMDDIIEFKKNYENLADESRVIMTISDRLQRKLDKANQKIKSKNEEITQKNENLKDALEKVVQARVGKKASTILFTATILLFVSEEIYLGPLVEYFVDYSYLILIFKGTIALGLKFLESILESHFVGGEKRKIVEESKDYEVEQEEKPKPAISKLRVANQA